MLHEVNDFLFQCRARGLSEKTIKSYKNVTTAFVLWLNENHEINQVEQVRKTHIQNYLKEKLDEGRKTKYVNSILKVLRAFFVFLELDEYIIKNPVEKVRFVKEEKRIIEVYTDSEVMSLIGAYDDIDYLSIRNKTIIALQVDTGIRCSETIDIKLSDILDDRIIIHGKGKKIRTVPISIEMSKLLRKYMKVKSNYYTANNVSENLFISRTGRPLTVEAIERIYKFAGNKANITRSIRISPHTSRHYYAVKMLQSNDIYTVSKLLGHGSVKITEVYLSSITNDRLIDKGRITSPLTSIRNNRL